MTDLERIALKLDVMYRLVRELHELQKPYSALAEDVQALKEEAREIGLDMELMRRRAAGWETDGERTKLLGVLCGRMRGKGWTNERIARAIPCSVRTVERHMSRQKSV